MSVVVGRKPSTFLTKNTKNVSTNTSNNTLYQSCSSFLSLVGAPFLLDNEILAAAAKNVPTGGINLFVHDHV